VRRDQTEYFLDFRDHLAGIQRFSAEAAVFRYLALRQLQLPARQDDLDAAPALMDGEREPQAAHAARHLNIGKQQHDIGPGLQDGERFVGVSGLDRDKTGILDQIDRAHPQQHFVFDDEDDRRQLRVVRRHLGSRYAVTRRALRTATSDLALRKQVASIFGQIWLAQFPATGWMAIRSVLARATTSLAFTSGAKPGMASADTPMFDHVRRLTVAGRQSRCAWGSISNQAAAAEFRKKRANLALSAEIDAARDPVCAHLTIQRSLKSCIGGLRSHLKSLAARYGPMMTDASPALSNEEFASLIEVSKGETQQEIPQLHWERLVGLGYAVRRLGELGLTASGLRRLALGE
jgi:hypothetical protein